MWAFFAQLWIVPNEAVAATALSCMPKSLVPVTLLIELKAAPSLCYGLKAFDRPTNKICQLGRHGVSRA